MAVCVGVSRALVEKQEVFLLGYRECPCSLGQKQMIITADNKNELVVRQVTQEKLPNTSHLLSEGCITSRITKEQIDSGVLYRIDPNFFSALNPALEAAKQDGVENSLLVPEVSKVIADLLCQL
jgi:hypothetical protein